MVTFRAELKTAISDLLADSDMTCSETEEALISLIVALADYREEDIALFPQVLICDDLPEVLRVVQGSAPIRIGDGNRSPETMLRALKKCAPLAVGGWAIWVERCEPGFTFGVFREHAVPTAVGLRSTLQDLEVRSLRVSLSGKSGHPPWRYSHPAIPDCRSTFPVLGRTMSEAPTASGSWPNGG